MKKKIVALVIALLVFLGIGLGVSRPWESSAKSPISCAKDKDRDCPKGEAKSEKSEK